MVKGADAQIVFSLVEVNFIWFHFLAWFNLPFIKIVGASHNPRVYLLCNTATAVYVVSTYFYLNWVLLGFLSLAIMLDFFGINIEKKQNKKTWWWRHDWCGDWSVIRRASTLHQSLSTLLTHSKPVQPCLGRKGILRTHPVLALLRSLNVVKEQNSESVSTCKRRGCEAWGRDFVDRFSGLLNEMYQLCT